MLGSYRWALIPVAGIAVFLSACSGDTVRLAPQPVGGGPTIAPIAVSSPNGMPSFAAAPTASPAATVAPTASPVATVAPTASPKATVAPSPTPSMAANGIVFNPTRVVVAAQKQACTRTSDTFTASEAGYTGTFTAVSNNTSIVTVSPAVSTGSFTVTSVTTMNGGLDASITVTDALGRSANVQAYISTCLP